MWVLYVSVFFSFSLCTGCEFSLLRLNKSKTDQVTMLRLNGYQNLNAKRAEFIIIFLVICYLFVFISVPCTTLAKAILPRTELFWQMKRNVFVQFSPPISSYVQVNYMASLQVEDGQIIMRICRTLLWNATDLYELICEIIFSSFMFDQGSEIVVW